jgi:hypothetical protein
MAKPIFGRGLVVRCERSEHGKSQLFIKFLCPILTILAIFYLVLSFYFFITPDVTHCAVPA